MRVYRTLTCDYCTYACAVNEDGELSEDPQTYSAYIAMFSEEGTRVMAVEAMGECECLCCRAEWAAEADANEVSEPSDVELYEKREDPRFERKTRKPEAAPQRERAIVEAELQDAQAKVQAAAMDADVDVGTITQMGEAAQRLRDELKTLRPEPMASCTGLL